MRRWFTSSTADLFVWYEGGEPVSFEFCYDKPRRERSVRWTEEEGLHFYRIDALILTKIFLIQNKH